MSKQWSYDDLYGVSLDEYYNYLDNNIDWNQTASGIIPEIVRCEIEMLERNYQKYAQRNETLTEEDQQLVLAIRSLLEKKRRHFERLKNWKGGAYGNQF